MLQNSKLDIGLLDFGQTKRFTRDRRLGFARLVDAMARKDTHGIARYLESLDIKVTSTKRQQERQTLERKKGALTVEEKFAYCLFDTAGVRGVSENPFAKDSALQYGSFDTLPRDLVFLLRTMQIMRGICKATKNPDYSMVASWGRRARSEIQNGAVAL